MKVSVSSSTISLFFVAALYLGLNQDLRVTAQPLMPLNAWEPPAVLTNLSQLSATFNSTNARAYRDFRLDVLVCAASRPKVGVYIVQDSTGVEVLELEAQQENIIPGDEIRIEGRGCLLRRRDFGIEISAAPVVDNDGLHERSTNGEVTLKSGFIPLRLDWYNCTRFGLLDVSCRMPNGETQQVSRLSYYRPDGSSGDNLVSGLHATCYEADGEGYWQSVPNFRLLRMTRNGVLTNFDVQFRTRDEMVAVRFAGYFKAPIDGAYQFQLHSDDGSLLFLGNPAPSVTKLGTAPVPRAIPHIINQALEQSNEWPWMSVEGRVHFILRRGTGLKFELRSERNSIWVALADSAGLDPAQLLNSYVQVTGVGRGVLTTDGRFVLGELTVAGADDLRVIEQKAGELKLPPLLDTALQVQSLRPDDAKRGLPVRIRGVVTSISPPAQHWMSIQDNERGIFVGFDSVSNAAPALGELWEVNGHTEVGSFTPVVQADQMNYLGPGRLPEPARPTWNELNNGAMDVQWVEFRGLVTGVQSNTLTLLLPEGHLDVQLEGYYASDLAKFQNAVVRIRGVLYAVWNAATRQVRVGQILMRDAIIDVDIPAPANPFDVPVKTPGDLYLFDAQATAFQRVKVRGQVIHADRKQLFLTDHGQGLQVLSAQKLNVVAGDLIEAVGCPDISGPSPLLREAIVRKTGTSPLPASTNVDEIDLPNPALDSTCVKVKGTLLGWHLEGGLLVLEMQSGRQLYFARVSNPTGDSLLLRTGSQLALNGVYVNQNDTQPEIGSESFHLLLNSPADIKVLSQPSWWTLKRLLVVVGVLLIVLVFSLLWITQLRRLVEQRTAQLQDAMRERERVGRQHVIEAERSRIARDLHDDLGSSLTEIGVLASTGQLAQKHNSYLPPLFEAIAGKAKNLIASLDVIVWAVDPAENSLQSLADYLSGYTSEYFAHTNIRCRFKVPVVFPSIALDGHVRHELFLSVKEALNNVVRHAGATEVEFQMTAADNALDIVIADNGKGFNTRPARDGHGLENLSSRLNKLGGSCIIESRAGGGTTIKIHLPLPSFSRTNADVAQTQNTTND